MLKLGTGLVTQLLHSVALGNVDGDGQIEIVTGGYYFDGIRKVAQLVEWNGANLLVDRLNRFGSEIGNTTVSTVAIGDVDGEGQAEIVTGGRFNDGSRDVAQLFVWNGADLTLNDEKSWYWTGDTAVFSVAICNVDGDGEVEIITGGYFYDGSRGVAQLVVWEMSQDRNAANCALGFVVADKLDSDGSILNVAYNQIANPQPSNQTLDIIYYRIPFWSAAGIKP